MNIALLAHDNKTELMLQFCTAYCGILFGHWLYAPATTGNPIQKATGLPVRNCFNFSPNSTTIARITSTQPL